MPLAYLITFTTYGTWLHGDEQGSVDRAHNAYGTPHIAANQRRVSYEKSAQKGMDVALNTDRRDVVRQTIVEVCSHRGWTLRERALYKGRHTPWTEHGSTRYLWKADQLDAACRYVLDGQGPDL